MKIVIIETGNNSYTAIVDGEFADRLTKDEVLGVVASALFAERPLFVRTYEQWHAWNIRYGERPVEPAGLLMGPN